MNDGHNQPTFSRVPVQLFVQISHDTRVSSNKTHDVSLKGLFVHTGKTLPIGTQCQVNFMLEGSQGEQSIEVCGQVVHVTNAGMALEFYESDLKSYQRLRSLILFNFSDAAQAEEGLDGHVGFKRS